MKEGLFKEIVKDALMFGIGGALLAMVAPTVAVALGFAATPALAIATLHIATPAWLGIFFGMFGGIASLIKPAIASALGGNSEKPSQSADADKGTQQVFLTLNQEPEKITTTHRACVEAERSEPANQIIRT